VAAGTPAAADAGPEPFAREARYFTEVRTLNKEVKVTLQGVSQFGVLVASVQFPPPPGAPAPAAGANGAAATADNDLASALLKAGLARTAEWGLNMMTTGSFRLRELERSAKQGKVGMWHNYVPQTGNSAKLSDKFTGTVTEVVSGDCLLIKDKASGVERRVNLSSIRTPRMGTRDRAPEPWAVEAKEFLRCVGVAVLGGLLPRWYLVFVGRGGQDGATMYCLLRCDIRGLYFLEVCHPVAPPQQPALHHTSSTTPRSHLPPPRRQRLIGKEVSVSMEYNRKVQVSLNNNKVLPC
jgi:endonuclease YncB( thermonuclease family)